MYNTILTIIASHGITDMIIGYNTYDLWISYLFYYKICNMLNIEILKYLFFLFSTIHFSFDLGFKYAVLFTILVPYAIYKYYNVKRAINYMLLYLVCIHVPLHYKRLHHRLIENPKFSGLILGFTHLIFSNVINFYGNENIFNNLNDFEKKTIIGIIFAHIEYTLDN